MNGPLPQPEFADQHRCVILTFSGIAVLWSWFQFFDDTAWHFPLLRGVVLAGVAAIAMLMALLPPRVADSRAARLGLALAALTGMLAGGWLFAAGARSSKAELGLIVILGLILLTLPMLGQRGRQMLAWLDHNLFSVVVAVALLAFAARLLAFHRALPVPYLEGIGQTTLDAIDAVRHGHNPYATPVDFDETSQGNNGYKYTPAMMAVYAPLGIPFGKPGLRITNLLLDGATMGLMALLAARLAGRFAGAIAVLSYLLMPMLAFDLFTHGVTDPASVVPMLAALLLVDKRPAWAGSRQALRSP